jgi:hypothetical protein
MRVFSKHLLISRSNALHTFSRPPDWILYWSINTERKLLYRGPDRVAWSPVGWWRTGPQHSDTIPPFRDAESPSRSDRGVSLRDSWNSVTAERRLRRRLGRGSRANILLWGWHRYSYGSPFEPLYKERAYHFTTTPRGASFRRKYKKQNKK